MRKISKSENFRQRPYPRPIQALQTRVFSLRHGRKWIALLMALVLFACGTSPSERLAQPGEVEQATLTPAPLPTLTSLPSITPTETIAIWLDWDFDELRGMHAIIERYRIDHPEVQFAITYRTSEQLLPAFVSSVESGQAPSILLGPSLWGPDLREQGLILNLSPLLDPGMESNIHPIAWTQAAEGTQLFGLPLELLGMVLYRNRTLAAEPVADVEQWQQIAEQMAAEDRKPISLDLGLEVSLPLMAGCGEEVFNPRGELLLFERGGECWLNLLTVLGSLGQVDFSSDEGLQQFKSGQTAWVIASTEMRAELIEAVGVTNLEVDPWPVYGSESFPLRGFTWSENAYLVAGSSESNLEASWNFLQFLFSPEAQGILSDPGGAAHIPTTSATELTDGLLLESSSMLRTGIPYPLRSELELVQEPILAAIQAVVLQGADPNFALRLAEERLELLRSSSLTP